MRLTDKAFLGHGGRSGVLSSIEIDGPELSTPQMAARSLVLVLLLFGALIPTTTFSVQTVCALVALPLVGWEFMRLPRPTSIMLKVVLPVFGAFLVGALINPPTSEYGQDKVWSFMTATLVTALAASIVRNGRHFVVLLRVWLYVGLAIAVIAALGPVGTGYVADRAVGLGSNPIWLARPIASSLLVLIWLYLQGGIRGPVAIVAAVILSIALIDTGSRGPLLAAAVAIALVCTLQFRQQPMRTTLVVLPSLVLYLLYLLIPVGRGSRIGLALADPSHLADATRSNAFRSTINTIVEHPGGVGWGNWSREVQVRTLQYPHNLLLEWAAEGGLVIAGVLVVACAIILVRLGLAARKDPLYCVLLAMLVCEFIEASVSGSTIDNRTLFFLLSLGVLALRWSTAGVATVGPGLLDLNHVAKVGPDRPPRAGGEGARHHLWTRSHVGSA